MQPIRPWPTNPRYWELDGQPVLLVGGSKEDNLFQIDGLEPHLDLLHRVGGNYVRCTMSSRDPGDQQPHANVGERFDLTRWNDRYWRRFEMLLRLASDRGIVAQIEVWDRFDFTSMMRDGVRQFWADSSWNPANNVNYSAESSGLPIDYPEHPSNDRQPFFHTVGGLSDDVRLAEAVLAHQRAFVETLVAVARPFGNVLWCMNNETTTPPAWGRYWMAFIRERHPSAMTTDMFDAGWKIPEAPEFLQAFDDADAYPFLDISQNNNLRNSPADMWRHLAFVHARTKAAPRPINNVKVYGADTYPHASRGYAREGDAAGMLDFWIDLFGGSASARFHRPPAGLGLGPLAQNNLKTVRLLERHAKLWDFTPDFAGEPFAMTSNDGRCLLLTTTAQGDADHWLDPATAEAVDRPVEGRPFIGIE